MGAAPARASGDLCEPRWGVETASLGECDTIAALTPGDDTRADLLMRLFDRHGLPASPPAATAKPILGWRDDRDASAPGRTPNGSTSAAGEGSRCRTNDGGTASFEAAVEAAASLPAPPPLPSPVAGLTAGVRSEAGRAFAIDYPGSRYDGHAHHSSIVAFRGSRRSRQL